jgi:glycosyltransferase involved in cell wall biosynthesis
VQPFLSIIIPAYNEENRLPNTLEKVFSFLAAQSFESEVIVVENGSTDNTAAVARQFSSNHPTLKVIEEEKPGKGGAVRRGMLAAKGTYRFMADADLSMPIEEVLNFLPPQLDGYDIAIASREAIGAVRYNEPPYRHIGGRFVNLIIRLLALPGLHDTQCGFKCFHGPTADVLFKHQTLTGWSFDIELLYIAQQAGYKILEIPIPWYYREESKVNPIADGLRMIKDIIRIRQTRYDLEIKNGSSQI